MSATRQSAWVVRLSAILLCSFFGLCAAFVVPLSLSLYGQEAAVYSYGAQLLLVRLTPDQSLRNKDFINPESWKKQGIVQRNKIHIELRVCKN